MKTLHGDMVKFSSYRDNLLRRSAAHSTAQGILAGLETEKFMRNRKHAAPVSHSEATDAALRADRGFAVEDGKSALQELDNPEHRAGGLLALRDVAEACVA